MKIKSPIMKYKGKINVITQQDSKYIFTYWIT